jgi:phage recombination protein Bet
MSVTDATTGEKSWRDVIMKGISELRTTAARTGEYAGQDDPEFGPVSEYLGVSAPEWCKVTVYRIVQGQRVAFTHTEYFTEAVATTRKNNQEVINRMWSKRPRGQLAKCAEAGALRKGFPEEIGGELAAEEMEGKVIDGTAERIDPIDTSTVQRRSEPKRSEPKNREDPAKKAQDGPEPAIPENGVQLLERKMEAAGVDRDEFCHAFGVEALVSLPASKMTAAIKWINEQA